MNRSRIIKISTLGGHSHYCNVYIDGHPILKVPSRLLSDLGIEPGDEISALQVKDLEKEDEFCRARLKAVRLLGIRLRTEEELRRSLIHADFSYSAIEETIDSLKAKGVLDDRVFAGRFAEEKRRIKGYAPARIESDLRSRGVAREIAHGAAWGVYETETADLDSSLLDEGIELLKRKQAHYEGLRWEVARRRMAGLLGRAGYPASVTFDAVDAVLESMQSRELLTGINPEEDQTV